MPVKTYGTEIMALIQKSANKWETTQYAMERAMLGISLGDWIRNTGIRRHTVTDIMTRVAKLKYSWARFIAHKPQHTWLTESHDGDLENRKDVQNDYKRGDQMTLKT